MEYYEPRIIHGGKGRYGQYHKSIGNSNVTIDGQYTILMQEIPSLKPPDIYLNGIKMFQSVQIQTIEFCNLKCDFCPNHYLIWDRVENKKKGIPYNLMTVENYTKIVKNLSKLNFQGRFSPYLMN